MNQSIIQTMKNGGYAFCGTAGGRLRFRHADAPEGRFLAFKTWEDVRCFCGCLAERFALEGGCDDYGI